MAKASDLAGMASGFIYLGFGVLPLVLIASCVLYPRILLPICAAYFINMKISRVEHKGGNPWEKFSRGFSLWKSMRRYFPLTLHAPETMKDLDKQYIFGIHPHGVCTDYRVIADGMFYKQFPKLHGRWRTLAASILFQIPIIREVCIWTSCVDASKASAEKVLKKGYSVLVVPGGEREQILTEYQKEILFIKKRFGFVKLAIQFGTPLIPVYVFGTNDLYRTSRFMQGFRMWLVKSLAIALPIFYGKNGFPTPYQVPLDMVFGEPLPVPENDKKGKNGAPSNEQVAKVHQQYTDALTKLFDENKARFGFADRKLQIL